MSTTAVQRVPSRGRGKAVGAPKAPMPGFIEPCDPTLHETAPTRSGWVYEIKTDGYRAQVHIRAKRVNVYSRSGYDWSDEFAPIAKAAAQLKVREAIIDGEATVLGNTGLTDFQALRRELRNRQSKRLTFHAFDLLYLNGRDFRGAPLLERKKALKSVLDDGPPTLVYVDFLEADGTRVFEQACRMGLEGMSQSGPTPRTVPAARTPGSSSNASRVIPSRSSPSWKSLEHARARSLHSMLLVGRAIGLSTPVRRVAATARPSPEKCGNVLIH